MERKKEEQKQATGRATWGVEQGNNWRNGDRQGRSATQQARRGERRYASEVPVRGRQGVNEGERLVNADEGWQIVLPKKRRAAPKQNTLPQGNKWPRRGPVGNKWQGEESNKQGKQGQISEEIKRAYERAFKE